MMKELEDLYNESRSNGCIEHALGIIEEKKTQDNLSEKISNISLTRTEQLEKFLLDKLDVYESVVGDSNVKCTPRIAGELLHIQDDFTFVILEHLHTPDVGLDPHSPDLEQTSVSEPQPDSSTHQMPLFNTQDHRDRVIEGLFNAPFEFFDSEN
ncbi:hypothetical protein Fmac_018659 [Flemingia macrophylla]|uniref:Uncharacterized protein n=1 Tax=Flemingia macrophylla TaxID=520843 RepID=A0ABD1M5P2_9FABA